MLDDLQKRPDEAPRAPEHRGDAAGPVTDREVPISATGPSLDAVHRWLDGEGGEADARAVEGGRYVDLWKKLDEETARRRQVTAPAGLTERIMLALPEHAPITPSAEGRTRKPIELSPAAAAAAAAGLVALGMAIGSRLR